MTPSAHPTSCFAALLLLLIVPSLADAHEPMGRLYYEWEVAGVLTDDHVVVSVQMEESTLSVHIAQHQLNGDNDLEIWWTEFTSGVDTDPRDVRIMIVNTFDDSIAASWYFEGITPLMWQEGTLEGVDTLVLEFVSVTQE